MGAQLRQGEARLAGVPEQLPAKDGVDIDAELDKLQETLQEYDEVQ